MKEERKTKYSHSKWTIASFVLVIVMAVGLVASFFVSGRRRPNEDIYYADISVRGYGVITVELDSAAAPETVGNFIMLAQDDFYDDLTFHRIIEGFVMQGGDPNADGTGGSAATIKGEFSANGVDNPISHTRGTISMARGEDYDSGSSQFFIVQQDCTELDGWYAAFGRVVEGMDIVDAICADARPIDGSGLIARDAQPIIGDIEIYQ